ncbi:MAG: ABC transporter ATP-binding protein [Streptosporangiaceae bacterium]
MIEEAAQTTGSASPSPRLVLELQGLTIHRRRGRTVENLVTSLDLKVQAGEIVGLVGESGSGKSLTALACLRLLPPLIQVANGDVLLEGSSLMDLDEKMMRSLRGRRIGMVFQDPLNSLDPCARIGDQVVEAVRAHSDVTVAAAREKALQLLDRVGIARAKERMRAYPHELSGGMRQRVGIAAALILRPSVLIADEPTTALDVTTQASILELVRELRAEMGMSVVWISHDLAVVGQIADRVAVMYAGEIVESGATQDLFKGSNHPYTDGLIRSATRGRPGTDFGFIPGTVAEPGHWPAGCRFRPRCDRATQQCEEHPHLEARGNAAVRCFHPLNNPEGAARG